MSHDYDDDYQIRTPNNIKKSRNNVMIDDSDIMIMIKISKHDDDVLANAMIISRETMTDVLKYLRFRTVHFSNSFLHRILILLNVFFHTCRFHISTSSY